MKHNKKVVGYVSGVFDLFHIGHLNLLERAKRYCDYLIVGVVADDVCFSYKNRYPIICTKERKRIILTLLKHQYHPFFCLSPFFFFPHVSLPSTKGCRKSKVEEYGIHYFSILMSKNTRWQAQNLSFSRK